MTPTRLVSLVLFSAVALGGCQAGEPIVPREISTLVNEQGRERTYDLAWQDIRRLIGAIDRSELEGVDDEALLIVSRMNRLAEGRASGMTEARYWNLVSAEQELVAREGAAETLQRLATTAGELQDAFDAGDFFAAEEKALQVLVYSTVLAEQKPSR